MPIISDVFLHKKKGFVLDPRTKLIVMIILTSLLIHSHENIWVILVSTSLPCLLLFFSGHKRLAISYACIFAVGFLLKSIRETVEPSMLISSLYAILSGFVLRLLPIYVFGGYILKTTSVGEFVATMQKIHLSDKIIIPFTVAFRFLPTISEESRSIKYAMKMRGITFGGAKGFKSPTILLEYRLIPLIISIVKIGEELSAAAITKGLGSGVKRTSIARIGFTKNDFAILFFIIILVLMVVIL